jgi:sugar phosphate isomerase/epimerase
VKLGISSWAFPWSVGVPGCAPAEPLGALDLVAIAAHLNVRVLQLADNLPLDTWNDIQLGELRAFSQQQQVQLEVGTRGIGRGHLLRYLQIAQLLDSALLRVVIDTPETRPTPDEVLATLRGLTADLETAGVMLAIENHDRFHSTQLVDILQRLDSPAVGICLDTANSLAAMEGTETVVRTLGPWTVNLHIKDVRVRRTNAGLGLLVEGCPAGAGQLGIPALLADLAELGRQVNVIVEHWPPQQASLAETLALERRWAEQSVGYLRQWIKD